MSEKYGFVYIWYDRWRKMFYIGCHWGKEDDGYICSSNRMRDAYRRRPDDFKRRVVFRTNESREVLLDVEDKWLKLIKEKEIGKKYYNIRVHKFGHWSANKDLSLSVGAKISASPLRRKKISEALRGKKHSEETKKKLREINLGKKHSEETKLKISMNHGRIYDDEFREKARLGAKKRPPVTEETRKRMSISASNRNRHKNTEEKLIVASSNK